MERGLNGPKELQDENKYRTRRDNRDLQYVGTMYVINVYTRVRLSITFMTFKMEDAFGHFRTIISDL